MLETMSQMPPSQTWLDVCKMGEKKITNPNNIKLGFVQTVLPLDLEGVRGQALDKVRVVLGTAHRRKNTK